MLRRVEPNEMSKTPEGRRERKNEATTSVEVDNLAGRVRRREEEPSHVSLDSFNKEHIFGSRDRNDPFIDQAAGLLLSLGNTVA
jgi:hypothetical protein